MHIYDVKQYEENIIKSNFTNVHCKNGRFENTLNVFIF